MYKYIQNKSVSKYVPYILTIIPKKRDLAIQRLDSRVTGNLDFTFFLGGGGGGGPDPPFTFFETIRNLDIHGNPIASLQQLYQKFTGFRFGCRIQNVK